MGTPKRRLTEFEEELLLGDWEEIPERPGIKAQRIGHGRERYVRGRSTARASWEKCDVPPQTD